ncbi:MFS transporter [Elioraea rosea]|uniref:MFS transporter n=1 Tax=Elioraea rosea TaxID=2492390 RepID=UPI001EF52DD0|nr:MFS transporter [Elioraea rosea]
MREEDEAPRTPARPWRIAAWCFYDWANSAYPTVIGTFVFATYFTQGVAPDPVTGASRWGVAMAVSGLLVGLLSPVFGAIADRTGGQRRWLAGFTVLAAIAAAALWTVEPDPAFMLRGLVLVVLGTLAFELGTVFYNAMLPVLAPQAMIGRVSGWGWGLGYVGGLFCLLACLALIQADPPPFGLSSGNAEAVRATSVLVALWYAGFALPLLLVVPGDRPTGVGIVQAVREGIGAIIRVLPELRSQPVITRFLIARLLYAEGLNTLFAFGAIYAAGTFGMDTQEVIQLGIAINVTAGLGAALFAFADDRFGSRNVVLVSVVSLMVIGAALLFVTSVSAFWALALPLGLFFGPAQAASRTLMGRLAPKDKLGEYYGLFALTGRAVSFIGPAVLAAATAAFASQRAGMATILVFLAGGAALLWTVREPGR